MSCLDATFTLTPKSPYYHPWLSNLWGDLSCYGATFWSLSPYTFTSNYADDCFYFDSSTAAVSGVDYSQWANRRKVPHIQLYVQLPSPTKELALIFGIKPLSGGVRLLIYDDAGLISDYSVDPYDNQFLLEIESLAAPVTLYFVHAGGPWFFKGISGYQV